MKRTLLRAGALVAMCLAPPIAEAGALRSDVQFLLPKESGEVAYLDLIALRASPHYFSLKNRLLPPRFGQFERFARIVGVEPDKDLDWLAWALVPPGPERPGELFLGLAEGRFSPERVEQTFRLQKRKLDYHRGQTLFPMSGGEAEDLVFTFLDSSTVAFGTRTGVELLLATRFGNHENLLQNELLTSRMLEVNGRAPVWVVLDAGYTRLAVRQLLPEAAKFPEFERVNDRFHSATMQIGVDRSISLRFEAWCEQPVDAQNLTLLLQTGFMAQSWQAAKANPPLSSVLRTAVVNSAGVRVEVRVEIPEQDVRDLLAQATKLY
jgi:hypothetical protein